MKTEIVLVSGKQGSGKTETVNQLMKIAHRYRGYRAEIMNFADPIREMHDMIRGRMMSYGLKPPEHLEKKDGPLMQHLGTEWGRMTYGEDVWVNVLKARVKTLESRLNGAFAHLVILVGDCRFMNEFSAFKDQNVLTVRLECPDEVRQRRAENWRPNTQHISETDLDAASAAGIFDQKFYTHQVNAIGVAELIFHQVLKRGEK